MVIPEISNAFFLRLWLVVWIMTAFAYFQEIPSGLRAYEVVKSIKTVHASKDDLKDHMQYVIQSETRTLELDLQRNSFLMHKNIKLPPGNNFISVEHLFENCHYQGKLRDGLVEKGRVVLSNCDGLQGTIIDDVINTTYFISYLPEFTKHILYKDSDISGIPHVKHHGCKSILNEKTIHHTLERKRRHAKFTSKFKYVSMAIVTDKAFFERQHKNLAAVTRYISSLINHVDHIYSQTDVRVFLTHLDIWTSKDNLNLTSHTSTNLGLFSDYNQNILIGRYKWNHDNAHLITGIPQQANLAGLAAIGTLCAGPSVAMSQAWSNNPGLVANTVAHEFGHNFGLYHIAAGSSCKCPNPPCLMTEYVSWTPVKSMSDCSVATIAMRCNNGICACLDDKPKKVHNGETCGNGLVEKGEECDCGLASVCTNPCCNAITCKLRHGAQCAHGECCSKTCQMMSNGVTCRKAVGQCDISEKCNGISPECPQNIYIANYIPCENGKSYCHDGVCTDSLDDQCKKLWGPNALHGTDECDLRNGHMNMRGNQWGNCGKNDNGTYIKCLPRDVECGKVHCYGDKLPSFIIFGQNRKTVFFGGKKKRCRSGQTMAGSDIIDPTLAKHGTQCGQHKICHNQKCVDAAILHDVIGKCHGGCGKNGYCTNSGHCFCSAYYKCPDCVGKDPSNLYGKLCKQPAILKRPGRIGNSCGCANGGVCDSNGFCFCQAGFKCPDCNNRDLHNKHGVLCDQKMKKCSIQCYNGGSCNTSSNSCFCPAGTRCPYCVHKSRENIAGLQCQKPQVTTCNNALKSRLEHVGCRVKLSTKNKGFMLHNFRSSIIWKPKSYNLQELACKCGNLALSKGYKYFAIQYWGECWSRVVEENILSLPPGTDCVTAQYKPCLDNDSQLCSGKNLASFVYKISR